jgi:hypothetical protein
MIHILPLFLSSFVVLGWLADEHEACLPCLASARLRLGRWAVPLGPINQDTSDRSFEYFRIAVRNPFF